MRFDAKRKSLLSRSYEAITLFSNVRVSKRTKKQPKSMILYEICFLLKSREISVFCKINGRKILFS